MELVRLENVVKTYRVGEIDVPVLKGVSFSIQRGEMVALMGASGSGKTTLMNILGCLDRLTSGKYWFDGQEVGGLDANERARVRTARLGFVFQSFNLLARTTAIHNVLMPLDYASRVPAMTEAYGRAFKLLDRVGLTDRMEHVPSQLSGGQQQRVAIARALINQPDLLLADEPTGNLDSRTSREILRMLQQLNEAGTTIVLVTHDAHVASYAHRIIHVVDGLLSDEERSEPVAAGLPGHGPYACAGNGHSPDGNGSSSSDNGSNGHASSPTVHPLPLGESRGQGIHEDRRLATARGSQDWTPDLGRDAAHAVAVSARAAMLPRTATAETTTLAPTANPAVQSPRPGLLYLLLPAALRTATSSLRRNKMRSALTTLGVIIGVGAVIAMVEISQGSRTALMQTMATMGANTLIVQAGAANSGGITWGGGSAKTLTPQDAEEIRRTCPATVAVAPAVQTQGLVVYGNRNWVPMNILGTSPSYLIIRDWQQMDDGVMFTEQDLRGANKVCVIGRTLVKELFDGASPVGKTIRVKNVSLRVVGVLGPKGSNMMGMDQDDIVIAPWTTIKFRVSGNNSGGATAGTGSSSSTSVVNKLGELYPGKTTLYPERSATQLANNPQPVRFVNVDQILVKAASADEIKTAIAQITVLMHERHRIREGEPDDFNIRDMSEFIRMMTSTSKMMGGLLLIVALISLAVGGVGIMNIMLVSVTERTREIGLRMAVGARAQHILRQFLIEAVVLCLFGGAMGIALGRAASVLVWYIMRWPVEASLLAIIGAFAVSAAIGIAFGFYPAWKASRLDPIEALRYE